MLSVLRRMIPSPRVRRRRPSFPSTAMSNHMLRDLGFDGSQVREILEFIAGPRAPGVDAELSFCARAAANSNDAGERSRVEER